MADGRAQQEGTEVDLPAIGYKLIVNVHSDRIDLLIIFNEAIVHLLFICTPPPSLINHHIFEWHRVVVVVVAIDQYCNWNGITDPWL